MKIPEYNRQVGLDIAPRSGVSIKEPEIFRDTSSMQRIGKQVLGTAEDMSNVYLDMKKERDNGIVNEFMNQFSLERVNKLKELQEQYKGANSEGIVDAYMEWQEDYISKRTGFNQNSAEGELYLENDEQIKAARDSLAKNLPSTVNSLSDYVARELEDYKKKQFEARVELKTMDAVNASDDNLQFELNELHSVLDNKYVGEPAEFIELQKRKLDSNIYTSRLGNAVAENPNNALVMLQDKRYTSNVDKETLQKIEKDAVSKWIQQTAGRMASANTLNPDDILTEQDAKIIAPYVEKYGKDRLEWDIVKQARTYINARKDAEKEKATNDTFDSISNIVNIQNNGTKTKEEKAIEIEKNIYKLPYEEAADLSATLDNIMTIEEYQQIQQGMFNREDSIHTEDDIIAINERERNPDLVAEGMDYIDNGEVIELKNFHPEDAKILLDRMALSENWRKLNDDWKKQTGQDLNKKIDETFNFVTNKKAKAYPFYNFAIKNELAKYVQSYKQENGKYPQGKDFEKIITDTISSINNQNPNISKLIDIENIIVGGKTGYSEETFLQHIDDKFGDSLSKKDKTELASALMQKKYNKALYIVNPVVIAQKQIAMQKEQEQLKQEQINRKINIAYQKALDIEKTTKSTVIKEGIKKAKAKVEKAKTLEQENKAKQEVAEAAGNIAESMFEGEGGMLWKQIKGFFGGLFK